VAITMGDPAGIGPEIILKAFAQSPELTHACCVFGDLPTLQKQLSLLAPLLPRHLECLPITDLAQVGQSLDYQMPVIQCGDSAQIAMGQISAQAGAMAAAAISAATAAALTGKVAALVTAPVNKKALQLSGVEFPGHTEMLQSLAAQHLGLSISGLPVRMMLSCPSLRVVLVSIHVPLSEAISLVNFENVLQTFQVTHDSWLKVHGTVPRMTVAGLNPHVFMQAHSSQGQKDTDVVIAMYHDQGLIPVKYLGLDNGVNQTLGLPFVRTSPDHGTAFDIAGKGVANPSSLLAALKVATGQRL